ncbi:LacI family transcriptional regulator [Oenococcus kitaharae]|nr:LacI family transcriptional regulator [Oenococcus kitaharae]OEY82703.1 LacI family transcriptional regulator [Oenococcus kitaharae]OEY84839.1 LacI family transcriptional regulator [Oenococcus kitaharae]
MAGVSSATISRFINGKMNRMSKETAAKIADIIDQTGFVVNATARQLSTHNSQLVAVVAADIDDYFSTEFFKGASSVLEQNQLTAILFDSNSDKKRELTNLKIINHQVFDGLIIQPLINEQSELRQEIRQGLKTIIVDRDLHTQDWTMVTTNNYSISQQTAAYFRQQQFDDCIVISEAVTGTSTREDRSAGIRTVFPNASLIEIDNSRPFIKENEKKALAMIEKNRAAKRKTLFFFLKERLLLAFFPTFMHHDLLSAPDIAITAFSDTAIVKRLLPDSKLIKQDPFLMGATAAEILADRINNQQTPNISSNQIVIPAKLQ